MTNSKATKKALFMSMLSLLLCFTMLMGATFAWFTDTVTSKNNRIVAGNLDVDLVMYKEADGKYVSIAGGNGDIFSEAEGGNGINWEPGKTEIVYLGVKNLGSLALKYNILLDIVDGEIPLSSSLEYALIDGAKYDTDQYANWNAVKTAAGNQVAPMPTGTGLLAAENGTLDGVLTNPDVEEVEYFALAVHMKEEATNEYQNGSITIDVTVVATQLAAELDSFDDKYDEDAFVADYYVSSVAELLEAFNDPGKTIGLMSSFADVPVTTKAPYGNYYGVAQSGGVLDGNGNTLDFDLGELNGGKADNYGIMTSGGTIKNITITGVFRGIMIMNPTEDIIIDNVTIGDEDMCYAINTGEGDGTHKLIVKNSTIKGWNSYGTAIKSVTFINTTFAQGEYYSNVYGRLVKPYVDAVFDGCEFNSKYYIDLSQLGKDGDGNVLNPDAKIILKNCTVNGVKLTAENWKSLIVSEDYCGDGQISIEAKDGSYMTADNVLDYVIIQ